MCLELCEYSWSKINTKVYDLTVGLLLEMLTTVLTALKHMNKNGYNKCNRDKKGERIGTTKGHIL